MTGRKHTAETRAKMSAAPRIITVAKSPDARAKVSAALKGKPKSEAHRRRLAEVNRIEGITWQHGRAFVYAPDHPYATKRGRVKRSRLVVERHIGRVLEPHEVVHHVNQNPTDDRIENLEVMTRSAHMKLHADLRWHNRDVSKRLSA